MCSSLCSPLYLLFKAGARPSGVKGIGRVKIRLDTSTDQTILVIDTKLQIHSLYNIISRNGKQVFQVSRKSKLQLVLVGFDPPKMAGVTWDCYKGSLRAIIFLPEMCRSQYIIDILGSFYKMKFCLIFYIQFFVCLRIQVRCQRLLSTDRVSTRKKITLLSSGSAWKLTRSGSNPSESDL